jgi:non-specific protein-tyrosine kinase
MEEEIDLRQYIEVLRRWVWLIVLGTVLAALTAFVVSLFIPPTYEAEASVVVAKAKTEVTFDPNIKTVSGEQLARANQAAQRQTLADLVSNPEVGKRVAAVLGDVLSPEEQDVHSLSGMVEAKTDRNSNLIRITVRSADPEKAAEIANAWAKEYVDYVNNQVYSGTPQTPEETAAQAKEAKARYDKAETKLVQFLGENQIAELQRQIAEKKGLISALQSGRDKAVVAVYQQQVAANVQALKDLYALRHKLDSLLSNARSLQAHIQAGSDSPTAQTANTFSLILVQASSFTTAANLPVNLQVPMNQLSSGGVSRSQLLKDVSQLIQTLESKRNEVQAEIDTLSTQLLNNGGYQFLAPSIPGNTTAPGNIQKKPLSTATEAKSQAQIQPQGSGQVTAAPATAGAATIEAINQLQKEVDQLQAKLESVSAQKQELTRARDLAYETYKSLARKVAEVDVAAQSKSTEVKFAVPAVAPRAPVAPRKKMNTLLAGVVGLMLTIGVAFVAEYMDDSLRADEAERLLQLPVLAEVPSWDGPRFDGEALAFALIDPRAPLTESLRSLRTSLQVLTPEPLRSLLVTSPDPEEGKSTVVANLGIVMAQGGKKVVLVDGDLRRPTLHKHFGLPNEKGLSNLLVEKGSSVANFLQETGVPGLRLMASGPLPPSPADLLSNGRLSAILEELREGADVMLVDSPAAQAIPDALLLAKWVDGVLLVAEPGATSREAAVQAQASLGRAGARLLGVVLTKMSGTRMAAYRYYATGDSKRRRSRNRLRMLLH